MFGPLSPIISSSYQRNRQEFLGREKALVWNIYLAGKVQAFRHVLERESHRQRNNDLMIVAKG
jgi:hypothetical protein